MQGPSASNGKRPIHYDAMANAFRMPIQDRGTFMCAGGVPVPNYMGHTETPPTRQSSRRASRGHVVTSPSRPPFEACMHAATETLVTQKERQLKEEEDQVLACVERLRRDGVEEGTELHHMATAMLGERRHRLIYMSTKKKAARISWISWTWKNVFGK